MTKEKLRGASTAAMQAPWADQEKNWKQELLKADGHTLLAIQNAAHEVLKQRAAAGHLTAPPPAGLTDDILRGAKAIAEFIFGDTTQRRRVYHLAFENRYDKLPVFRLGRTICARRSTLLEWIAAQERESQRFVQGRRP